MLYNLLKSFFNKFNAFVQWTKKWHLLHIISILLTFVLTLLLISYNFELTLEIIEECIFGITVYLYPIVLIISTLLAIIVALVKFFTKQPIYVENKFLLSNPAYNIIYFLNLIYILSVYLMLFVSLFSFFNTNEFDKVDNLMAIGFGITLIFLGLIVIVISYATYIIIIFILNRLQKHKLTQKESLPFRN